MITAAGCKEEPGVVDTADKWRDQQWQNYMWGVDVMRETVERCADFDLAVTRESERVMSLL